MTNFRKAIFTAASPNTQADDAFLALRSILSPWNWRNEKYRTTFVRELQEYLAVQHVHTIDSGRSALHIILQSFGIGSGDEVILPSFTCVVVANATRWTGAEPVYLDTSVADFNARYDLVAEKVTEKTKAIVVQHTFGKRVDVIVIRRKLREIGRDDIKIIEDFAHVIQRNIGLEGDAGFLTFGIEKVLSSVRGGAVITNDSFVSTTIQKKINGLPRFPDTRVFISLANPIFWWIAIPLHSVGIGRFTIGAGIRWIWRKFGFLGIMVEEKENRAEKPDWFPAQMSPILARLGSKQLKKLDFYNEHRSKIAAIYNEHLHEISDGGGQPTADSRQRIYLRYPVLLQDEAEALKVWNIARSLRITLGNWFSKPLYGNSVNDKTYAELCYIPAQTPVTLDKCSRVLNLPTSINISEERARELAEEIKRKRLGELEQ